MINQQEKNFIALLAQAVVPGYGAVLTEPSFPEILALAEKHAVTSLLYPALKKQLPFGDPILSGLKKQSFGAATRESVQSKELSAIYAACQKAEIPILPLKGCVIKALYPYPELRFMSDADLLIPEEKASQMRELMENLGHTYRKVDAGDTDVYLSPLSMNYEIHLNLEGEGFSQETRSFTRSLLEIAHPTQNNPYLLELPPEEHYIYVLCHFIKHFIYGGVGVRQLTDLFICYHNWNLDLNKVDALLQRMELTAFHKTLQELWDYWFCGGACTELSEELGSYILHSGVFGNEEQRAGDRLLAKSQEQNYVLARLFPSYSVMKGYFPILKKLPFLLPFAWIWRVIRAVLFRRQKLNTELQAMIHTKESDLDLRRSFYDQCGLSVYDKKS
jgi:hypothetical protein